MAVTVSPGCNINKIKVSMHLVCWVITILLGVSVGSEGANVPSYSLEGTHLQMHSLRNTPILLAHALSLPEQPQELVVELVMRVSETTAETKSPAGSEFGPGLHLYWDSDQWVSLKHTGTDYRLDWRNRGLSMGREDWVPAPEIGKWSVLSFILKPGVVEAYVADANLNWHFLWDVVRPGDHLPMLMIGKGYDGGRGEAPFLFSVGSLSDVIMSTVEFQSLKVIADGQVVLQEYFHDILDDDRWVPVAYGSPDVETNIARLEHLHYGMLGLDVGELRGVLANVSDLPRESLRVEFANRKTQVGENGSFSFHGISHGDYTLIVLNGEDAIYAEPITINDKFHHVQVFVDDPIPRSNLVVNGGFENAGTVPTLPQRWTTALFDNSTVEFAIDNTMARSSSRSMRLTGIPSAAARGGPRGAVRQIFDLDGTSLTSIYKFSAWYRTQGMTQSNAVQVRVRFMDERGRELDNFSLDPAFKNLPSAGIYSLIADRHLHLYARSVAEDDWVELEHFFIPPLKAARMSIELFLWKEGAILWWDDIQVQKITK